MIMGNQHTSVSCCDGKYVAVGAARKVRRYCGLEINGRLVPQRGTDDCVLEIGIGLEADFHQTGVFIWRRRSAIF